MDICTPNTWILVLNCILFSLAVMALPPSSHPWPIPEGNADSWLASHDNWQSQMVGHGHDHSPLELMGRTYEHDPPTHHERLAVDAPDGEHLVVGQKFQTPLISKVFAAGEDGSRVPQKDWTRVKMKHPVNADIRIPPEASMTFLPGLKTATTPKNQRGFLDVYFPAKPSSPDHAATRDVSRLGKNTSAVTIDSTYKEKPNITKYPDQKLSIYKVGNPSRECSMSISITHPCGAQSIINASTADEVFYRPGRGSKPPYVRIEAEPRSTRPSGSSEGGRDFITGAQSLTNSQAKRLQWKLSLREAPQEAPEVNRRRAKLLARGPLSTAKSEKPSAPPLPSKERTKGGVSVPVTKEAADSRTSSPPPRPTSLDRVDSYEKKLGSSSSSSDGDPESPKRGRSKSRDSSGISKDHEVRSAGLAQHQAGAISTPHLSPAGRSTDAQSRKDSTGATPASSRGVSPHREEVGNIPDQSRSAMRSVSPARSEGPSPKKEPSLPTRYSGPSSLSLDKGPVGPHPSPLGMPHIPTSSRSSSSSSIGSLPERKAGSDTTMRTADSGPMGRYRGSRGTMGSASSMDPTTPRKATSTSSSGSSSGRKALKNEVPRNQNEAVRGGDGPKRVNRSASMTSAGSAGKRSDEPGRRAKRTAKNELGRYNPYREQSSSPKDLTQEDQKHLLQPNQNRPPSPTPEYEKTPKKGGGSKQPPGQKGAGVRGYRRQNGEK